MVEFVLLGIPSLLIFINGVTLFLNNYVDTIARAIAVDSSRYASLADQTEINAQSYVDSKIKRLLPNTRVLSQVSRGTVAIAQLEYQLLPTMFNLNESTVQIKSVTPIEKR